MIVKTYITRNLSEYRDAIRYVEIFDDELQNLNLHQILDEVFTYGQNDLQPKFIQSLSVGDIIIWENNAYFIELTGFSNIITGEEV